MPKRAQEQIIGTGNLTMKFGGDREELVLVNDGPDDLTFTIGYFTFVLKAGDTFDEVVNPFNSIQITTTSSYRGFVRDSY
jgi:hypothetical protein